MDVNLKCLLTYFGFDVDKTRAEQIKREEDDSFYDVWRIYYENKVFIIKECKEYEAEIYNSILKSCDKYVPGYYGIVSFENKDFILLENLDGINLNNCSRKMLISFLDSLISLQKEFWQNERYNNLCFNLQNSLVKRKGRGEFLFD